ncbi:timeless protein-domain-containing protein [Coemansia spiralis]|nr:timeless protein-domain-containing protein [Coemansia spiralis]
MEYVPSEDCLSSLKDIKRYIQMDEQGEGKLVLQWLGEWQVLERDIIPIFTLNAKKLFSTAAKQENTEWDRDSALKVVMLCVELFVFTTWSMDSEPEEVKTRFIRVLRSYKRAFVNSDVVSGLLAVAVMYARKSVSTEKEAMLIKGILYVFRNVLAIPDPFISPTSKGISQLEVHDKLIAILDKELAIDFFLTLASSASHARFKDLRPTLLDIIYYIFYRVPVSALFDRPQSWFKTDNSLKRSGRHSNFGGVYAVSTGEGTIMPVFSAREVLQPFANLFKKRAKIQKPKETTSVAVDRQWRTADSSCITILRRVAATFIESCFNPFIGVLFEDTKTSTTAIDEIVPRLLYISAYFVDISLANPEIDLGCTCVLVQTHVFGQIMRNASTYIELKRWSELEQAMYCIQQSLLALGKMRGTKLDSLSEFVLSNLFYDGDALDLFVKLCRVYKPTRNTRAFLEQAAQLTETFLRTLKEFAQAKAGMLIKKRMKKRSSKKADTDKNKDDNDVARDDSEISTFNNVDEPDASSSKMQNREDAEDQDIGSADEAIEEKENDAASDDDDSNSETEVLVERTFDFARYESAFAVNDVVKSYSHLLAPPSSIENVYPMLYRIAITSQRPQLFFKKPIMLRLLVLFDDQFNYPRRTEMLDLAAWIFRQYMTVITSPSLRNHYKAEGLDNKLAVECMLTFLKNSGLGTSVKPVITRHIVELLAEGEYAQNDTEKSARATDDDSDEDIMGNKEQKRSNGNDQNTESAAASTTDPSNRHLVNDDINDFDFDDYFNL